MFKSKKPESKSTGSPSDEVLRRSVSFEVTLAQQAQKREKIAWVIAGMSVILAFSLGLGYLFVMPLKEKEPYLIVVDKYTGTTSHLARLKEDEMPRSEALDKSNMAKYVIARESYEWFSIGRDWQKVLATSSNDVAGPYRKLFEGPNSLDKTFGKAKIAQVKILSVTPKGNNQGVVRFQKTIKEKQNGTTEKSSIYVADITYKYDPTIKMDEKMRIENPIGFFVISYRTDIESTDNSQANQPEWAGVETTTAGSPALGATTGDAGLADPTTVGTDPTTTPSNHPNPSSQTGGQ